MGRYVVSTLSYLTTGPRWRLLSLQTTLAMMLTFVAVTLGLMIEEQPNASCISKKLPCANLGLGCTRPRSVFMFKIRGTGGKLLGEG